MTDVRTYAKSQNVGRQSDDTWTALRGTRDGAAIAQPWLQALVVEGKMFACSIGTITTPVTGDIDVTTVAAEMATEAATGYAVMPVRLNVDIESLNGGTLHVAAFKSVNALITTLGTAFTALNHKIGGPAVSGRSAAAAAGGVAVAAEAATTTRVHFRATQAAAANNYLNVNLTIPPLCVGPASFYLQVAGTTAGPLYFANYDFIEFVGSEVS